RTGSSSPRLALAREEGRGFFQDLPLLLKRPHPAPQLTQLDPLLARKPLRHAGVDRRLLDPDPQRLRRDAEVASDLSQRAAAAAIQRDRLTPELRRIRLLEVRSPWHGATSFPPDRTVPTKRSGVHENGGIPPRAPLSRQAPAWLWPPDGPL